MDFTRNVVSAAVALFGLAACTPAAPSGFGTFAEEQALMKAKVDCVEEQFWTRDEWYCWLKQDQPTSELTAARQSMDQDLLNRALDNPQNSPWSARLEIKFDGDKNSTTFGSVELIRFVVFYRYAGQRDDGIGSLGLFIQGSDAYNNGREYFTGRFITEHLAEGQTTLTGLDEVGQVVNGPYVINAGVSGIGWGVGASLSPTAAGG